jgi:hypothetical protein
MNKKEPYKGPGLWRREPTIPNGFTLRVQMPIAHILYNSKEWNRAEVEIFFLGMFTAQVGHQQERRSHYHIFGKTQLSIPAIKGRSHDCKIWVGTGGDICVG